MGISNFFDKLTEETMGLGAIENSYIDEDIVGFFNNRSLLYYELCYHKNLDAYRTVIKKNVIDFPASWSDFSKLSNPLSIEKITDSVLPNILKKNFFQNNLVESFILLRASKDKYYLLVCPEGELELMNELSKFFGFAQHHTKAA